LKSRLVLNSISLVLSLTAGILFMQYNLRNGTNLEQNMAHAESEKRETAVIAGGCFWCMEATFQRLRGVEKVVSGYSGGKIPDPTYEQVSSGTTGHAEAVELTYDPSQISYAELLEVFFHLHDPTTLNRQGNDVGTQYRSAIFYKNGQEKKTAEEVKAKITREKLWSDPIVTEITPFQAFYPAEAYHQNYYNLHPHQGYCSIVIAPKIIKLEKEFADKLKPTSPVSPQ
jgi:peptide-methionine (S)-S-oxide reductase